MKNVVIIGAGPAGITAGLEILRKDKNNYNVTIIESESVVGGISKTVDVNGNKMDLGGHRFFSKISEINQWWNDILPENNPEISDSVFMTRNRLSRIYYKQKFFDYPISAKPQTFINMGLKDSVKAGCGYIKSAVKKLPDNNLENFYINKFGKPLYSMFFEGYTEKLWGRHPSEISADWGAQRVKGLSIKSILKDLCLKTLHIKNKEKETSLIESFNYPKYGPGQMWTEAANKFKELGGTIITNQEIIKINKLDDKVISVESQNNVYECDYLFSSMPIKDLVVSMDTPNEIQEVAASLPYRDFVTLGLLVDKTNIDLKDNWLYIQDTGVKLGRIQVFNNWSPYMVKDNGIWLGLEYFCNENDDFWNMTEDELVDFAVNELITIKLINQNTKILNYHREKVKKAYPAYFDSYKDIDIVIDYLNNIENIYCIGRNGQHRYNNMDHSMMTAIKAVDCLFDNTKNKKEIWKVNTEKEYHENKADATPN